MSAMWCETTAHWQRALLEAHIAAMQIAIFRVGSPKLSECEPAEVEGIRGSITGCKFLEIMAGTEWNAAAHAARMRALLPPVSLAPPIACLINYQLKISPIHSFCDSSPADS